MTVILLSAHHHLLDTHQDEHQQKNIATLLWVLVSTLLYHVGDETVKSHPMKDHGVINEILTTFMWMWKDTEK